MRGVVLLALWAALGAACSIPTDPATGIESVQVHFSEEDRRLIRDFYRGYDYPPELRDPAAIAPDLETRIELSATLPPDIAAFPLSLDLQEKLSPLPPGYTRFRVGQDVVLMDVRTREVVDVVIGVFEPDFLP